MKLFKGLILSIVTVLFLTTDLIAQVGFFDAPYTRYEADQGDLNGAAVLAATFNQGSLQSEASEQVCVNLFNSGSSVSWTVSAAGDGLVVRYSVPDGQSGTVDVYSGTTLMGTLNLTSQWSWQYLNTDPNPNSGPAAGVVNGNPKMRFDEVRMKLSSQIPAGGTLKLVRTNGNVTIDFAELEPVPPAVTAAGGDVTYNSGNGTIQNVIDNNPGKTIYLPPGVYQVGDKLWFPANNTTLKGAGMWYTQINFTNGTTNNGGLWAKANNISFEGLYLTTNNNARSNNYKAINGSFIGGNSHVKNVWAEHFECGAWIAVYDAIGPNHTDGLQMSYCRFRNNYADGTNLCKGTVNSVVEHCSYRNNGDDDMAIWSANSWECANNTFRYCTSENTWRSAGVAIYGGTNNKAQNILIQDNIEVGIKVNNAFPGSPFGTGIEFSNIIIKRCGTSQDLFNTALGAIDLGAYDRGAGTQVKNVTFSCISVIDSKNDGIYLHKAGGDGFYNIAFQNITVDGTGRATGGNRTGIYVSGSPGGSATYCGMTYANNATNVNTNGYGFSAAGTCPTGCSLSTVVASTTITSSAFFGICSNPITLTATSVAPASNTTSSVEFFVDNTSIGSDNSGPSFSVAWNNPVAGTHQIKAVSTYSGGSSSTTTQDITVAGIYQTATAPAIDGSIDAMWSSLPSYALNKVSVGTVSNAADLTASFKVARDASNFYILVDVTDDILRTDGTETYQKDAIEMFIDMGNNKSGAYVANSDYQFSFIYGVNTAQTGLTFAQTTKTGNLGYVFEIRIPWATLNGAPAAGTFMGFDLHVNDNDTGTRDAKKAWKDGTDNAWQSTAVLGTLEISTCAPPASTPVANFTNTTTNCTGQTITFTDASTGTPTTWAWNFGTGATPATASTQGPHNVVYSTVGAKTVTLTVSNTAGNNPTSKPLTIGTVLGQPGAITGTTTPCSGANTYSITAVGGATSYTWTLPNGWTGTSTGISISATSNGTGGTISVVANNACGASPAQTVTVTAPAAPAQPGAITGTTTPCSGANTYSITAVGGATSYTWTLPNGWTGTSTGVSIPATSNGTGGTISVVANNACGGTSPVRTLVVTGPAAPAQPGAITGTTTPCSGANTYSITAVGGATSYTWTLPNGWTGTSTSVSIPATSNGTGGTISVVANNACGGTSPARTLVVTGPAAPAQPGAITGTTTPCSGANTYSITAVGGATSYTWTLPNGWTGTSTSVSIPATSNGTGGTISVVANNACGGTSPVRTLVVTGPAAPAQPGAITGTTTPCSGANTYSITAVGGATSYTWTLPNGWTGTSTGVSIPATSNGTGGTISVVANNVCGGTSPARTLVVTGTAAPAQPGAITGTTTPCSGANTYSITAVGGATSYTWTLPNGWTGTSTGVSISATSNGTGGTISVVANNACGGTSPVRTLVVTGPAAPAQPGAITGTTTPCSGANTYSITAVGGATSYTWTLPNGWTGTSTGVSISATSNGTGGTISVVANNACGGTSPVRTLVVTGPAAPAQPGAITGTTTPCSGANTYSITAVGGATSYTWTLPNGWTGTSTGVSIPATSNGTGGTISVVANNVCGGTSPARTLVVTGPAAPAQPGAITGTTTPCSGANTYSITAVGGATSYTWTLPNGWTGTSTGVSISATSNGTGGTISVVANNACGGTSPVRTLVVTGPAAPAQPGAITGTTTPCSGANTYSITAVGGATSYTWTLPNGWTGTSTSISISATSNGAGGTISVVANNACGGTSAVRTLVVTGPAAPAQPGAVEGLIAPCSGISTTYSITAVAGATSYTWTLPNGWSGSSTTTSISVIPSTVAGTIRVIANNSCGGTSIGRTLPVTISSVPLQPGAISGPASIGVGSTNTYGISPVSGAISYIWTLPGGWTGTSASANISATAGTSGGDINVAASNTCGVSASRTLTVSMNGAPATPGAISGPSSVTPNQSGVIYSVPLVPGVTYTWSYIGGNGVAINGSGNEISINFGANATSGTLAVTAKNASGTSSASTISITVGSATGIEDADLSHQFQVYPNPAASFTTIKIDTQNNNTFDITISDMAGAEVQTILKDERITKDSYTVSLDGLAPGMYLVKIISEGKVNIVKLMKE